MSEIVLEVDDETLEILADVAARRGSSVAAVASRALDDWSQGPDAVSDHGDWFAPAVAAVASVDVALGAVGTLAGRLADGVPRDDLRIVAVAWQRLSYAYDEAEYRRAAAALDPDAVRRLAGRVAALLGDGL